MLPIDSPTDHRSEIDAQIDGMVSSGKSRTATARTFGITPAQVDMAIKRHARRMVSASSPYLADKMSVRMANVLHMNKIDRENNAEVLDFLFDDKSTLLKYENLGRKTIEEARQIARAWAEKNQITIPVASDEAPTVERLVRRLATLEAEMAQMRSQIDALVNMFLGKDDQ
jgi:hypothetical protein